jgi:N-terminal half of MaoC dehydratase
MTVDALVNAHAERLKRKIGHQSGPYVQSVEAGGIAKFARAIGETNPIFFDDAYARNTRFGGIIAPPTYASCFITPLLPGEMFELDLPPLTKALHSDDIAENDMPIRPGDVLSTVARYADVFIKQGRRGPILFQAADLTVTNQGGRRVALIRMLSANF